METDISLKVLSRSFLSDLLRLVHEEGLEVVSVDAVELVEVRRQIDCLIKLQGQHGVHYRHFESWRTSRALTTMWTSSPACLGERP